MWHYLEYMIDTFHPQPATRGERSQALDAVVIRCARDSDTPLLHDLADLDSAAPLRGAVLVAVVEGRIWAAIGRDDERVIADPFLPTAAAAELLRLRMRQLRAAEGGAQRGVLPRRVARRARA